MENDQELQEEMGLVAPETMLMTDIDKTAADLGLDPVLAPEVSMGVDPGQAAAPAPIDPSLRLDTEYANAVDVFDPFNSSIVEQVKNMIGAQYPTDPITGTPLPAGPLPDMSAAQGPVVLAPEEQIVQQKVGDITTTSIEPTAGMTSALEQARMGAAGQVDTAQAQVDVVTKLAQLKEGMDTVRLKASETYAREADDIYKASLKEMNLHKAEIARIRTELASQPWQSYWGSKDTGDKIMLSLAIGLGALGQAHIGGQNLAMAVIQSGIDDHNKSQSERFRTLEAQLNSAQTGSVQAQNALKGQFDLLIANKAAAYDQIEKQASAIMGKANTEKARLDAQKIVDETRLKANKELMDMVDELAVRTTKRVDIYDPKTVKGNAGLFIRRDGQPMDESQRKDFMAVNGMGQAMKDMEALEGNGYTTTSQYSTLRKNLLNEFRELGALTGPVNTALVLARFDSAVDRSNARDVSSQLYTRAFRKFIVDKLRRESGSAIGMSEFTGQAQTYLPSDDTMNPDKASQLMDLDQVSKYRRGVVEGYLNSSGSGASLWYMGGKK